MVSRKVLRVEQQQEYRYQYRAAADTEHAGHESGTGAE